jgi:hypothetical protein
MTISVDFIYQILLQILVQEQQGNVFNPDYFNNLLLLNTFKYFDDNYKSKLNKNGGYEVNQGYMDTLSFLKVIYYGQIDSSGKMTIPEDYIHYSSLTHHYMVQATIYSKTGIPTITMVPEHTPVDILTDAALTLRRMDAIKGPTEDFPICAEYYNQGTQQGYFQFYPENLQYAELVYLRQPRIPVWVGTFDQATDTYIYDPVNSVQIEFPDIDKYRFISYLLEQLGFSYQSDVIEKMVIENKQIEGN